MPHFPAFLNMSDAHYNTYYSNNFKSQYFSPDLISSSGYRSYLALGYHPSRDLKYGNLAKLSAQSSHVQKNLRTIGIFLINSPAYTLN